MSKRIILTIDDREVETLNLLLARYGGKAPAYFRYLLKRAFEQEFGSYKAGRITGLIKNLNPKIELTDEQYCESVGAKVESGTEGNTMCFVAKPGTQNGYKFPISERKRIKECAKNFGLI